MNGNGKHYEYSTAFSIYQKVEINYLNLRLIKRSDPLCNLETFFFNFQYAQIINKAESNINYCNYL